MDAQDGLAFGDHQPGEVLGEVPPLGLVLEEVAELIQGVLDDLGELDDAWHDQMPGGTNCAGAYEAEKGLLLPFLPAATDCLQSPSSYFLDLQSVNGQEFVGHPQRTNTSCP